MRRTVVVAAVIALVVGACTSSEQSESAESVPTSPATTSPTSASATSTTPATSAPPVRSTTSVTSTTGADPSQFDRDVALIMDLYDGWTRAVDDGNDAIEVYFAAHLYPELPACASGEKTFTALTADHDSIGRVDDWAITWGPLNGTIPDGRIYEVGLTELDSPSHVTILDESAYVFWNCTGKAPPAFTPPAARDWDYIYQLPDGLSCQALIEGGYSYEEAYVYWLGENDSSYMIDYKAGEEVICESMYPKAVVAAFWDASGPVTANQFAIIDTVDGAVDLDGRTIVADYANFYTGDDAVEACERESHTDCDNFHTRLYYISNTNPRLRSLPVAPDAVIAAWTWFGSYPYTCQIAMPWQMNAAGFNADRTGPACFYTLETVFLHSDFVWLTVENGTITGLQTQYVP